MAEHGRIGLCMCPGRKKRKKRHVWARDQYKDLDRLQQVYSCDVLVTLVREQELRDLRIEDLFDEVKKRGMQSLYAPLPTCQHSPIHQGLRNNHYGLLASQVSSDQGQMDPQVHSPLDRSGGEDPQLPS